MKEYTFQFDATRTIINARDYDEAEKIYLDHMSGPITKVEGKLMYQWDNISSEEIDVYEAVISPGVVSHEAH